MNIDCLKLTLIIMMGVSFLFVGCSSKKAEVDNKEQLPSVEQIDVQGFKELLQQNNGKITVVNFWATWCVPCREEMPALVRLKEHFDDRIELILVAIDDPAVIDSTMKPLLKNAGVNFSSYIKQEGNDEEFINAVNPEWSGALPTTFIYDSQGAIVEMLTGEQSYEQFEETVKKFIAE